MLDDESWDAAVEESHKVAMAAAGPGIGSPVLRIGGPFADAWRWGNPTAMTEPHVNLDPHDLHPVEAKLHDALEDQLTSALQAAADRVREDYEGESVDQVSARLLTETRAGLHPAIAAGFQPDEADLRRVAQSIVGTGTTP